MAGGFAAAFGRGGLVDAPGADVVFARLAVSFVVNCDDQAELDRYWNALLEGGSAEQCGWLKDRFGLSWQIVPTVLGEMMAAPDRAKAKRASDAMMKMVKIDIAVLQAAFAGTTGARDSAR